MSVFFTIVGCDGSGLLITDTDVSTNSPRSVRSYKTVNAAKQAISRGKREPGLTYSILGTYILADGTIENRWVTGEL
jgi:hypothetical protein